MLTTSDLLQICQGLFLIGMLRATDQFIRLAKDFLEYLKQDED